MKYEVEVQGREVSIELEERNGRVQARIGSRDYDLEVVSPEEGVYTFLAGDRVYEANVWASEPDSLRVKIGGHLFSTKIIDRKHRRPTIEHGTEGRQNLIAPMPGKVVRVLLGPGDEVRTGQGVVVVEAMKMQNEIKSPKSGHIVEVRVIEGATVNANQVLAVVE
ncbi:MAG: biotin/lipoyl-containing protein [Acidobacteriota bacterium]